ncbi:hypothetical protein ACET3Z_031800 [Daucus carota]
MEEASSKSPSSQHPLNQNYTTQKPTWQISLTNLLNHDDYSPLFSLYSTGLNFISPGILRKVARGLLGAAFLCLLLFLVMIVAVALGVGLVGFLVEEPVFAKENLLFDYSQVNPTAVFAQMEVPVGQTYYVDLLLVMPESYYNVDIGMFQLVAEVLSTNGRVIDRSSHPCMLRFRSLPVRLVRTCLFSIPLILGISFETQRITIPMLRHKEGYSRTEAIRITILPRAGTMSLPQLYEAEIIINSELPWKKELAHSWKWTLYVWTSVYMYILLLIVLGCWFRPVIFAVISSCYSHKDGVRDDTMEVRRGRPLLAKESREVSETLRRLKESRNKKKEMLLHEGAPETQPQGSSASSISVTRDDSSITAEDDRDSVSVCSDD